MINLKTAIISLLLGIMLLCGVCLAQEPTFDTYKPVFDCLQSESQAKAYPNMVCNGNPVYVVNEWAIQNPAAAANKGISSRTLITPTYALSFQSAYELAALLRDQGAQVFASCPFGYCDVGGFRFPLVPWIKFQNGSVENAGQLALWYAIGLHPSNAKQYLFMEINDLSKLVENGFDFSRVLGYPTN